MFQTLILNRYLWQELVWRDLRTRYLGSVLGFFWSVLNPLLQLGLYSLVFGSHLRVRFEEGGSTGSFAITLFAALLPWLALQESVVRSADVFLSHANLLKKVRFPLLVLPLSVVSAAVVHQLIGTVVFVIVLLLLNELSISTLPLIGLLILVQAMMMVGFASAVASLNVFFRDIAQILGIGFMAWFWMTPIVYPRGISSGLLGTILALNPMTYMVESYRLALLGRPVLDGPGFAYWLIFSLLVCWLGIRIVKRLQPHLLDRI